MSKTITDKHKLILGKSRSSGAVKPAEKSTNSLWCQKWIFQPAAPFDFQKMLPSKNERHK
jgi:hypothetical protein